MQDKAKLDSIINSAGQFKESTLPISGELAEATYSYGGSVQSEFNVGDTAEHDLLGSVTVRNASGSSVTVTNSKGVAYKVSPTSLKLVKRKNAAQVTQLPDAPAVSTANQKGAPVGQSITYNTSKGPAKFTKTPKGWEALVGTTKKLFLIGDDFYTTLEKMWQAQR